jgi:very-short-patch-repair endonuclease
MRGEASTAAERALWQQLRGRKLDGKKFRRQHAVGPYVVDFICAECDLAIELDGPIHDQTLDEDARRQSALESAGLRVLRFRNEEVLADMEQVLAGIRSALKLSPGR